MLRKLIEAYCTEEDTPRTDLRFLFDGTPVADTDTPLGLDMADEDVLDVIAGQCGG